MTADEQARVVPVMLPYRFGAGASSQTRPGPDCPVMVLLSQGGWVVQAQFSQNDAIDFARRIRQAVKDARSDLTVQRSSLLSANGQPVAPREDDAYDDLEVDEPARENEATA